MRIVISGSGSFIARAVADACRTSGITHLALRHDEALEPALRPDDCVINFAIAPAYRSGPYTEECDHDLRTARMATKAGAGFIMVSTRRVYGPQSRWNAAEDDEAEGDETAYGRNKARTEKSVREVCGGKAGIFRLANIFGYEYTHPSPRRSFLGQLLHTLKQQNKVFFDMHPATRRDFIPVELCADMLVARAADRTSGTFNLGSGFAVTCGELAGWIMEGFGGGALVCDPMIVRDEFFLNMQQWRSRFTLSVDETAIRDYCIGLGKRLQCEKS